MKKQGTQTDMVDKIKTERIRRGLTQDDVAKLVGIHRLAYHRIENGSRWITAEIGQKIASGLDIKLDIGWADKNWSGLNEPAA